MSEAVQQRAQSTDAAGRRASEIFGDGSRGHIKQVALQCFYDHGYHGTSVRDLAKAAGISVPALYHHFGSKQEILFDLISRTMTDLIAETETAVKSSPDEPPTQLCAIVRAHVLFHTDRREESFIGNTELRAFDADHLRIVIGWRDHQQRIFDGVVAHGCEEGLFRSLHPKEASRAVVTMCTAVATWYRRTGALSPAQIADIYQQLALSTVDYSV